MKSFIGTGVALITPFKKDLSVDVEALKNIVKFNIDGGVEYLVVLGTTAETATLSKEEQTLVKQTIIDANNGKLPLVLGVGGNNTLEVVSQLNADNLKGFDAILSVSPYYNKPTQEGIYQHFKMIAENSPLPIIIYNVPGRTASNMLPSTVVRLANDFKNIIGIKEAAGDMVQAMELIRSTPNDFLVISGDDIITLPMVLAGGAGVISVIGEAFPKEFSEMVRLGLKREVDAAYKIHYKLTDAINMIFEQGNPGGVKEVFKHLGLCENYLRLPLVNVNEDLSNRLANFVKNF
ncbi:4-hydroxy-tetrahydrodipicolinate synthase [Paenimyroides viscosum]|jgi:4-hydroxy-tetrahydrodipicolinate synthase|uniref:4-hydroxy-tetrahydrodipicolinate synthase n=1 Tax=Paenimyroides viscosum TaxID=2488729 RepID=A0A3P1ATL7_9FLAO|nr:4-hydroxy-tetrahydrodipicolinate synthase [Paenimyroides viscosum]RRA92278.1 4-hydroxy-tetrahydrodipicolinate synthase [Paenimyroides viscosum]